MDATGHRLFTLAEAADHLRMSQRQVRRLVAAGRLPIVQLSARGRVLVLADDLERLVTECRRVAA